MLNLADEFTIKSAVRKNANFKREEMMRTKSGFILILIVLLAGLCETANAQATRARTAQNAGEVCAAISGLSGVYRIDAAASDKLYSVIEEASSNVPYGEQQQFFMDLAVRLTPPDLLAFECRGSQITLGSSRAQRVVFQADGVQRNARASDGKIVRSRIAVERGSLIFNSSGGGDNLSFSFTPLDGGDRLRVTRRLAAKELVEPVVIQTVYNRVSNVARWDIYGETEADKQVARQENRNNPPPVSNQPRTRPTRIERDDEAVGVREALDQWIAATNRRNVERQMSFYMPTLQAFYLARNASLKVVRGEKVKLAAAQTVDIRAAEPEIIFQDNGRTAIMRFRKKYRVADKSKTRSGEVVQELRWQKTPNGWRIFSERDIRVIS